MAEQEFLKDEFIYDGGPTVITAPYLFEELFSLFNKNISNYVEIVPLDYGTDLYSVTGIHSITMEMINLWRNKLKNLTLMITKDKKFSELY